jgi:hypothetical protein
MGASIYKLQVNQSFTCKARFQIWGFPTTVEEIQFSYTDQSAICKLVMGGNPVLTLTVPSGGDGSTDDSVPTGYTLTENIPPSIEFTQGGGP